MRYNKFAKNDLFIKYENREKLLANCVRLSMLYYSFTIPFYKVSPNSFHERNHQKKKNNVSFAAVGFPLKSKTKKKIYIFAPTENKPIESLWCVSND